MNQVQRIYQQFVKHPAVSTDSRLDVKNTIFFALSGESFNGNAFAAQAIEKGARLAIVDDKQYAKGEKYILVENTLETLQQLATYHRNQFSVPLLAITGSNGKTTTKELVAAVLKKRYNLSYTQGNLNNHIGVPLSLLKINASTEMALIEMGANHEGEIRQLCKIALPDAGIITNIGKAHIEGFGSFEGVIEAKNELYDFIRLNNGQLMVNADDVLLMKLSKGIKRFTYGKSSLADITGEILQTVPYLSLRWKANGREFTCNSQLFGRYNLHNMLTAIATGIKYKVPPEQINRAIEAFKPENNRSQLIKSGRNRIVMDAYNANPVSMREAILSFKDFGSQNPWLILGDMFELGHLATAEHKKIIDLVISQNFENVLFVGTVFNKLNHSHPYLSFESTVEAMQYLGEHQISGADILVKGSRGMMLEKLIDRL